jgi:cytochrome c-type biogenesis protein CcmH/NrfG
MADKRTASRANDAPDRQQLEAERDFLLESLDDLEVEHASGGIDDESYAELHGDYTARAAATIRMLRDGVDARPRPAPTVPVKRRVAIIAAIVVFALVAGGVLAAALGARLPGQTASGNSQDRASAEAAAKALGKEISDLQAKVNASPNDYELRLQLADAYARNNDLRTALQQWDAAISIDPNRPEAHAEAGRALYLVSEQLTDRQQQQQLVGEARAAFDKAIEVGPDYPDSYFFRGILEGATNQLDRSQADLQLYLAKAPQNGQWRANALDARAQVTKKLESTTTVPSSP